MQRPDRTPPNRVTTRDVAARAGVSQPTVSLVLSRNPNARVADATRERVLQAAAELGYRPNLLAQGLVRRRSFALGLLVPDLRNPFFVEVVSGAERVAAEAGYAVFLCEQGNQPLERHLEALRARQVDGVILDAAALDDLPADARPLLDELNVVLVDQPASESYPGVATDALQAGRLAAEHLLALGHRRIGFVGPASDIHTFRMRERGFVVALREKGITLDTATLRRAQPTMRGGQEAARALLSLSDRPTALFCANDLLALGALKAAAAAGVVVPRDLSVVGCDDIELATMLTPELTTVAVPARALGARAARLLVQQLDGRGEVKATRPLGVELKVRGTTGPANGGRRTADGSDLGTPVRGPADHGNDHPQS